MKKIINGKLYDTSTAKLIGADGSNGSHSDFDYFEETLYKKRTGEYFLYGYGGPRSRYSECLGDNSWGWGEAIIPLSFAKAREWAEEHLSVDDYAGAFGMPDEGTDALHVELPAPLMARIKNNAAERRQSLKEYLTEVLSEYLK